MPMLTDDMLMAYLARIGFEEELSIDLATLKKLHRGHVENIPFENFSMHLGEKIQIDLALLFKKLVTEQRGGFCYEMNGLFYAVLEKIGFNVSLQQSRVLYEVNPDVMLPRSHQFMIVTVNDINWLCDVGFGGNGLREPLALFVNQEEQQDTDLFKLTLDKGEYILKIFIKDEWKDIYSFSLLPAHYLKPIDFKPYCYYVAENPDSTFAKKVFATIPTTSGRITLCNDTLTIREKGQTQKKTIHSMEEWLLYAKQYFGIDLPADTQFKILPPMDIAVVVFDSGLQTRFGSFFR